MGKNKTEDEVKPEKMSGFTIMQILAWTNAEIAKCREKLETEPSGRRVAYLQGKIPGCRFAIKVIRDIYGIADEAFDRIERQTEMGSLSTEQIFGAEIDMEELKGSDLWLQVLGKIEERTEEMKDFLLKTAKKSRELDEYQGEYQGMIYYQKVFDSIREQVNFWRSSLFRGNDDDEGGAGMRDANDMEPSLPAPALPAPDDYPLDEDYEEPGERDNDGPGDGTE